MYFFRWCQTVTALNEFCHPLVSLQSPRQYPKTGTWPWCRLSQGTQMELAKLSWTWLVHWCCLSQGTQMELAKLSWTWLVHWCCLSQGTQMELVKLSWTWLVHWCCLSQGTQMELAKLSWTWLVHWCHFHHVLFQALLSNYLLFHCSFQHYSYWHKTALVYLAQCYLCIQALAAQPRLCITTSQPLGPMLVYGMTLLQGAYGNSIPLFSGCSSSSNWEAV